MSARQGVHHRLPKAGDRERSRQRHVADARRTQAVLTPLESQLQGRRGTELSQNYSKPESSQRQGSRLEKSPMCKLKTGIRMALAQNYMHSRELPLTSGSVTMETSGPLQSQRDTSRTRRLKQEGRKPQSTTLRNSQPHGHLTSTHNLSPLMSSARMQVGALSSPTLCLMAELPRRGAAKDLVA